MQVPHLQNRIAATIAIALLLSCVSANAAPRGEDLMRAMMNAERTLSYSATETTTRVGGATIVARLQKSGGKKRLEYSAPAIMRGDLLIDDGQTLWRYHRAEKSAIKTRTPARSRKSAEDLIRRVTVTNKGQSTLGGRSAWVLRIVPRGKKTVSRKFWIDDKTKLRLRTERFDNNGKLVETTTLSNLKVGAVPASAFRWTPPAGIAVSNAGTLYTNLEQAQRKAEWLKAPKKLPSGYAFESAVVNSDDVWLRYSNGTRRFSIFQQRAKDSRSTPLRRAGAGWLWQKGKDRFFVAGLPEAQAEAVAKSVR